MVILLSDNYDIGSRAIRKDKRLKKLFHKMFFSNEIKALKKTKRAFTIPLKALKLMPEECIFIDDHKRNLPAAKKTGIRTILFKNNKKLEKEITRITA